SAEAATHKWGANELRVPRPGFWDLLSEQLVAPFFVFQTFCCILWLADEYWYYSLFTLAMLAVFESTVASQRLRNVDELMSLTPNGASLLVHRGGRWTRRSARELVPGDVVSVTANGVNDVGEEEVCPADLAIVSGDATVTEAMLTGESTPQRKRAIEPGGDQPVDTAIDKTATLFAGTRVLRAEHGSASGGDGKPPDKGCVCVVLRTGFGTAQGELVRTILHAGERVTADSWETGAFIAVLLAFASVASTKVLLHGLADPTRSRYKLFINCVTILTSVIPPELPMELSIAVNTSLIALAKRRVFCTEPFRVVDAGRCDVCCFDKTGTLTEDELRYEGVAAASDCPVLTTCPGDLSRDVPEAALALGSCHSLALVGGAAAGDPMERAGLAGCDWTLLPQDRSASGASSVATRTARVMTRHAFRSELRRMSAVVAVEGFDGCKRRVVAKGAPETMEATLRKLPAGYRRAHEALARRGYRVIALCAKAIPDDKDVSAVKSMTRKECESGLDFIGFAAFACRVKPTSAPAVGVLANSSHASVMITGDAPLTACHVAAEVGITTRPTLLLESDGGDDWWWATLDGKKVEPLPLFITTYDTARSGSLASLAREYDLAVCGKGLDAMTRRDRLADCVKHVRVYARTAPEQKTRIVRAMRDAGLRVMMCGDGTNDVGALRASHVGVALLDDGARARGMGNHRDHRVGSSRSESNGRESSNEKLNGTETHGGGTNGDVIAELTRRMDAADDRSAGGRLALAVRPGDASLAAPFTARSGGVAPCVDLVRQGRAALVASQQMFKILGLNCLCTAYVMSVQFLDGVKFGDTQMTCGGLITAGMFLALSRAAPSQRLAPCKPRSTIFTAYFFASVICQFAVHLLSLWYTLDVAKAYADGETSTHPLESPFAPNLINTVSFLVNTFTQTATVAVNYVGAPHCATLRENAPLFYSVLGTYLALGVLTSQIFPKLNETAELYAMPTGLASTLCLVMACDLAACWVIERTMDAVF
ncbi:p-type ATPase superfamily, partial [Micromonas commoda]